MKYSVDIAWVLIAHKQGCDGISISVANEHGVDSRIRGKPVKIVDLSIPSVTLLTEDSTPQVQKLDGQARASFTEAVEKLVETGQKFYTFLCPTWALPAVIWEKVE